MKRCGLVLLTLTCMLTASCSLLPEEETFSAAPLIREYEREEFELAFAERGDMELSEKISCTYVPVQTEALRYQVGGVYYDETFVEVGDRVEAGQLLAQLNVEGIEEKVKESEQQIEKLHIRIAALEENRSIALERRRIQMKDSSSADMEEAMRELNEQYDGDLQSLQDSLYLAEIQLDEYKEQLAQRQLRAGIAGTVTYIRKVSNGDRSVAGERFITIADSTMSLFRAETKYWDIFEPGQEYVIVVNKAEYEAIVASEEELGLKPTEKVEGEKEYVYFRLKNPSFELEDGDRGTLTVVLDSRENVLQVPESAVTLANGQYIVYYQDEEGMKTYKPVEIGLQAGKMVEIISGLDEGESVIVG